MGSGAVIYIPSFIKNGSDSNVISYAYFLFQNKESRLKKLKCKMNLPITMRYFSSQSQYWDAYNSPSSGLF
jgi:hypothetical protein